MRNGGLTKNAEKDLIDGGCELTVFEDVEADPVCTENLIRIDDVTESPKLAE